MIIPDAEREKRGNSHPITRNLGPNITRSNTYISNTNANISDWNGEFDYAPRRNSSPTQSYYNRHSNNSFANSESVSVHSRFSPGSATRHVTAGAVGEFLFVL